jgi:hypothetical protein
VIFHIFPLTWLWRYANRFRDGRLVVRRQLQDDVYILKKIPLGDATSPVTAFDEVIAFHALVLVAEGVDKFCTAREPFCFHQEPCPIDLKIISHLFHERPPIRGGRVFRLFFLKTFSWLTFSGGECEIESILRGGYGQFHILGAIGKKHATDFH